MRSVVASDTLRVMSPPAAAGASHRGRPLRVLRAAGDVAVDVDTPCGAAGDRRRWRVMPGQAPALRFPTPRPAGRIVTGPPREEWGSVTPPELSMVAVPKPLGIPGDDVRYWDRGVDLVPLGTGALSVMDCGDLVDACQRLNLPLPLSGRVLDIGCGTGRWQRYCSAYIGFDINPSAVEFCHRRGVAAHVIRGYR